MSASAVPAKFIEDFRSENQYQPSNTMDPESDAEGIKRSGTLQKKDSVKRSLSKKSRAGSIRSINLGEPDSRNSFIYTPVPTHSNPTEILVNRFQAWRKVLKDYILYFREVQAQYEARGRGIHKITQSLNAAARPSEFMEHGGIMETNAVLTDFHKEAIVNAGNAAKIETEVINNLTGLRSDLNLKIKEIKALSGDFKSNVDKEKESTKKEVLKLQTALETFDSNPSGGNDPYIVKLGVDRQLRRQLAEENYLHRAYLNLESSGRELEKIVVGEIQKAYNTYVKILARDGQELIDFAERLTASTLNLPADREWSNFVERDTHMVNPLIPMRTVDEIEYPGHHHPAVAEVRSGMLERKSKYLKSFTPAWYVLSPTHLHEFKTPDRSRDQIPVMSLYLPEASLGKHSDPAAVSHKFVLKARQTGTLHRGHSWVFRAESHAVMLEWYEAIKKLTEVSGAERNAYVQSTVAHNAAVTTAAGHRRSDSHDSQFYMSDNGLDNDEADEVPYSGQASELEYPADYHGDLQPPKRPEGGRFPSDIQVNRGLEHKDSLSGDSSTSAVAAATALPGTSFPDRYDQRHHGDYRDHDFAYTQQHAGHEPHGIEHNYVVVPDMKQRQADSSSSWCSDEKYGNGGFATAGYAQNETRKPAPILRTTGFGIDPITGEPENGLGHSPSQNSNSSSHIAFLAADQPIRTSSEADPREPIPPYEADPVAMNSGSLDAVAEAPPPPGEAIAPLSPRRPQPSMVVDDLSSSGGAPFNAVGNVPNSNVPVLNQVHPPSAEDRPHVNRDNSNITIGQSTISDYPMPGKYPKKV